MTPLWEQIANEWLNRGYHSEILPNGSFRLWYDGIVYSMLIDDPLKNIMPSEEYYWICQSKEENKKPIESYAEFMSTHGYQQGGG